MPTSLTNKANGKTCASCKNKLSNTVQDNHGEGWEWHNNTRICNNCYNRTLK